MDHEHNKYTFDIFSLKFSSKQGHQLNLVKLNWIMNTPRKKIATLQTLARREFEPGSSGAQADTLTVMPCHFP